jgi:hypothetical protein
MPSALHTVGVLLLLQVGWFGVHKSDLHVAVALSQYCALVHVAWDSQSPSV